VFSLNYERLGNRVNVAETGASPCKLVTNGRLGSRLAQWGGMSNIDIAVKSWSFIRFVYSNKLARLSRDAWVELLAFLIPSHLAFVGITSSRRARNLQIGERRAF
jgi:hypothetical protein